MPTVADGDLDRIASALGVATGTAGLLPYDTASAGVRGLLASDGLAQGNVMARLLQRSLSCGTPTYDFVPHALPESIRKATGVAPSELVRDGKELTLRAFLVFPTGDCPAALTAHTRSMANRPGREVLRLLVTRTDEGKLLLSVRPADREQVLARVPLGSVRCTDWVRLGLRVCYLSSCSRVVVFASVNLATEPRDKKCCLIGRSFVWSMPKTGDGTRPGGPLFVTADEGCRTCMLDPGHPLDKASGLDPAHWPAPPGLRDKVTWTFGLPWRDGYGTLPSKVVMGPVDTKVVVMCKKRTRDADAERRGFKIYIPSLENGHAFSIAEWRGLVHISYIAVPQAWGGKDERQAFKGLGLRMACLAAVLVCDLIGVDPARTGCDLHCKPETYGTFPTTNPERLLGVYAEWGIRGLVRCDVRATGSRTAQTRSSAATKKVVDELERLAGGCLARSGCGLVLKKTLDAVAVLQLLAASRKDVTFVSAVLVGRLASLIDVLFQRQGADALRTVFLFRFSGAWPQTSGVAGASAQDGPPPCSGQPLWRQQRRS